MVATKIAVVYYSMYGHVGKLAEAIKDGAARVPGVEATIYQVAETLPENVLTMMHAPPKRADVPIATPEILASADGILLGFPTRFGMLPTQMKSLFDATGGLWMRKTLIGKPCGLFFSTGSLGGGQEATAISTLPFLAHHGMTIVPLGYRSDLLGNLEEIHGGSPWGAGTIAGLDGSRQPSELELEVARVQGESFAKIAKRLADTREADAETTS